MQQAVRRLNGDQFSDWCLTEQPTRKSNIPTLNLTGLRSEARAYGFHNNGSRQCLCTKLRHHFYGPRVGESPKVQEIMKRLEHYARSPDLEFITNHWEYDGRDIIYPIEAYESASAAEMKERTMNSLRELFPERLLDLIEVGKNDCDDEEIIIPAAAFPAFDEYLNALMPPPSLTTLVAQDKILAHFRRTLGQLVPDDTTLEPTPKGFFFSIYGTPIPFQLPASDYLMLLQENLPPVVARHLHIDPEEKEEVVIDMPMDQFYDLLYDELLFAPQRRALGQEEFANQTGINVLGSLMRDYL